MKIRTAIAAATGAALLGTGALALPAAVASPTAATHTLSFLSLQKKSTMFTKMTGGQQDTDVKAGEISHGKVTGGTGAFKGATGTVKAKNLNSAGTRTAVTITYRT